MYYFNKPFPEYRWRWASLTPTERLNLPEVYFGCLRVLYQHQGSPVGSELVRLGLVRVQEDLVSELQDVTLARDSRRNIFRNSGQYWKMTGQLLSTDQGIVLSDFGKAYASGSITKDEFSLYIIKTLTLPNVNIELPHIIDQWVKFRVEIKPLEFLLKIIVQLYESSPDYAYITTNEIVKIIIPMVGHRASVSDIKEVIINCRFNDSISQDSWQADEGANDVRMAREFLLFLQYYDYLYSRASSKIIKNNKTQEFYIDDFLYEKIKSTLELNINLQLFQEDIDIISNFNEMPSRKRVLIESIYRPSQSIFRKKLLDAYNANCIISGAKTSEVLQACHIIPVKNGGIDTISNGLILRADLHLLYDAGHIRIHQNGRIELSDHLKNDSFYSTSLPRHINIPNFVDLNFIRMRNDYNM
ncbi:TPA: HNH endonuclease [Yersinia enterocolitica]|nr:HNH endonuclease [Yersinia enterocolitica]EKN3778672.1 HNH endonuclease [Yersinia enterocolitica]ELI7901934.1 HNH endonuclease [Yersinia enterocolitica]ELI8004755.1 HNH endonuclease [Yersinia enterocolitica]ELI8372074.1 HNH endonuclease [Yersinia enterocolitica]